jgi:hypothetical protein
VKGLQSNSMIVRFLLPIFSLTTILLYIYPNTMYGQSSINATQSWLDRENNVRILFSYAPTMPVIDAPTSLKFSIQNLQTGKPIAESFARVVILTNSSGQERIFKFTNITAPDGGFSVKYLFPDVGLYQVISTITSPSNDIASLSSFKVLVPGQPNVFSLNNPSGGFSPWIILAILVAAAAATVLIVKNKRKAPKLNI